MTLAAQIFTSDITNSLFQLSCLYVAIFTVTNKQALHLAQFTIPFALLCCYLNLLIKLNYELTFYIGREVDLNRGTELKSTILDITANKDNNVSE